MTKKILDCKLNSIRTFTFLGLGILLMFWSCNDDENSGDTTPPAKVDNVTFKPNNGGGTFFYKVPEDEDILFVKATYTLDNNKTIYRASSFYADSLSIEGLGSEKPYSVELVSVDRSGNESKPVIQEVTPLKPTTDIVLDAIEVVQSFSSIFIRWENVQRKSVIIKVSYEINNNTIVKKYSSNELFDRILIEDLETIPYDFSVHVEDDFENKTKTKLFSNISPLSDGLLDKSKFSFLRDEFLPDEMNETWVELDAQGMEITRTRTLTRAQKEGGYKGEDGNENNWNAKERNLDGHIQLFWDGIIDDGVLLNKNFFSTGHDGKVPFSYYIDLGQEVRMSRFRVWQRDWDWDFDKIGGDQTGYAYTSENVEIFELWISNDKVNWERVRRARIIKPFDEVEARKEVLEGHHFIAYEDNPRFSKPFRYLEYRGLQRFDKRNALCNASEISIYGIPN